LLREAGLPFAVPKAFKGPRAASLTELQMIVELTMLPAFEVCRRSRLDLEEA
jgi:hypothetical protein